MPAKIVATKSTVQIGSLSIDGYLTDAGAFGMSLSELGFISGCATDKQNAAYNLTQKMKSKQAQSRFPQGFQTHLVHVLGVSVKLINLDDVPKVLRIVGTDKSENLLDVLAGLSLQQLFCDAFGQKFDADDRQQWLKSRMLGIEKRNDWTDAIKRWLEQHPEASDNTRKFIYRNVSDLLNRSLTGHSAKHWKDLLGCESDELRDHWKPSHLDKISDLEKHAKVLVLRGTHPKEAMEASVAFHEFAIDADPRKVAS